MTIINFPEAVGAVNFYIQITLLKKAPLHTLV